MALIVALVDLRHERDVEQLRRVALAQQTQIEQLLRLIASQAAELGALKGNDGELQQKLAVVEELSRKLREVTESTPAPPSELAPEKRASKPRTKFGNTEQPALPAVEQTFELDAADTMCPSCGGALSPMKGQFETSAPRRLMSRRVRARHYDGPTADP